MTSQSPSVHPFRLSATWGKFVKLKAVVDESQKLAQETPARRNAVTIMFTGFTAYLGDTENASYASAMSSFEMPIELPPDLPKDSNGSPMQLEFLGYHHVIRGTINKDKNARAVLLINVAGSLKVVEYPYGLEVGTGGPEQVQADFDIPFSSSEVAAPSGEPPRYPRLPVYGAHLAILVERRKPDARVFVEIDNLEVIATFASPDGPEPAAAQRSHC